MTGGDRLGERHSHQGESLEAVLERVTDGIVALDREGCFTYLNREAEVLLRRPRAELLGTCMTHAFPQALAASFGEHYRSAVREQQEVSFEEYNRDQGLWLQVRIFPSPSGVTLYLRDVTERRRREQQLDIYRERQDLLAELLDSSSQPFVFGTPDGRVLMFNPAFSKLIGYRESEIRSRDFRLPALTEPQWREQERQALHVLHATKRPQQYMKECRRRDGSTVLVESLVHLYRDEHGNEFYYSFLTDTTDRRLFEQERENLLAQLQALSEVADVALSTLELDQLLERLLQRVVAVTGADAGLILLREGNRLNARASTGLDPSVVADFSMDVDTGLAGTVGQSREALYLSDAQAEAELVNPLVARQGIRTIVGVPLLRRDQLLGVLHVDWFSVKPKDEGVLRVLQLAADRCALAIANAQLYKDTVESHRLGDALNSINDLLHSTLNADEVLERVVVEAADTLSARSCLLFLHQEREWILRFQVGLARDLTGLVFDESEAPTFRLLRKGHSSIAVSNAAADPRIGPRLAGILGARPALYVPLTVRDQALGVLAFSFEGAPRELSHLEVDFAEKLAASLSLALDNARLYQAQLSIAETLQESLVVPPARLPGVRFGYLYRSATEEARVGGDFYDLFEASFGHIAVMVGDVSGHGVEAAARAAFIRSTIRAYGLLEESPAGVIALTNSALLRTFPPGGFASVFLGFLHPRSGRLVYCSAGHPPAVLTSPTRGSILLDDRSPVVGVFEDAVYRDYQAQLPKDAFLTVYTDGVTEARRGRTLFGEQGLLGVLDTGSCENIRTLPSTVLEAVSRHSGGRLADDIALISLCLGGRALLRQDDGPGKSEAGERAL